jgi:hypothetical protein
MDARELPAPRIEDDFHAWAIAQVAALREQNYAALDRNNLAEELVPMARKVRKEFRTICRTSLFICSNRPTTLSDGARVGAPR